jgi:hypothetical protein
MSSVCSILLACAPAVAQAQLSTSCSESVRRTCWTAGSLYFKDNQYYTVIGCQTEMYIRNTVVGSECQAKSNGYKMISAKQSNWVTMETKKAKWVGNANTGFCWRTTTVQDGYSVECSECKTYFDSNGQVVPCS